MRQLWNGRFPAVIFPGAPGVITCEGPSGFAWRILGRPCHTKPHVTAPPCVTHVCREIGPLSALGYEAPAELCLSSDQARQKPRTPLLVDGRRHNTALRSQLVPIGLDHFRSANLAVTVRNRPFNNLFRAARRCGNPSRGLKEPLKLAQGSGFYVQSANATDFLSACGVSGPEPWSARIDSAFPARLQAANRAR